MSWQVASIICMSIFVSGFIICRVLDIFEDYLSWNRKEGGK